MYSSQSPQPDANRSLDLTPALAPELSVHPTGLDERFPCGPGGPFVFLK